MKKTNFPEVGILGMGEIGTSLYKIIREKYNVYGKTRHFDNIGKKKIDILHIAIVYDDNFIKAVIKQARLLKPKIIIIDSTIPMGTTRKITKLLRKNNIGVVHSFVKGVHPHLEEGIRTFTKYIGSCQPLVAKKVYRYFKQLGLKPKIMKNPETTEAMKLWCTTQYGWFIILQKEIYKYCKKFKVDFNDIYTHHNQDYNEGYEKLGMGNVRRPILKQINGKISGHCVIPNCQILKTQNVDIAKIILKFNRGY